MSRNEIMPIAQNGDLVLIDPTAEVQTEQVSEILPTTRESRRNRRRKNEERISSDEFSGFPDLASLMNVSVEELKDEFFLFQIRKLMSKLAKTIIRFSVSDKQLEKIFYNSKELGIDQIVVEPTYIPACEKQVSKLGGDGYKVGAIIDFPFGGSTIKVKLAGVKECVRAGVDDVTVMMPSMLVDKEQIKMFRKQCAKLGKAYKGNAGIALNATDLDEEQIKLAIKAVNKTKLAFITFVFGSATVEEVTSKMQTVKKYKSDKSIFALANVDSAEGIMTLFKNGVDKILTPYADDIGEQLLNRFKIKSLKLK